MGAAVRTAAEHAEICLYWGIGAGRGKSPPLGHASRKMGNRLMKWFAAAMVAAIFTAQAVDVTALHANETVSLPNLIVVFIDDMGWSDLGCFGGAQGVTPHIDRLCSEGIRFTNFYVNSPICSPSRAALTTGCYPQRWKITSYLADRELNE